ncbi:hypothetical protein CHS0354_011476 [Potamilus streckersoni]|uniref:Uncharacterized protein n=1 Tax=Potamilus streckersoni TaxID=2493646 RepID=A0AAE0SKW1_9BIVA|nr:hypothetical protein CHS0354_011476 [Potamilus streckersoni]
MFLHEEVFRLRNGYIGTNTDSLNNNNNSYGSLEISGVGEKFASKSEHDVGDLLHEIADMKFHNRKLSEENAKLQQLLVAQDDYIAGMVAETERFQKKIKEYIFS